MDFDDYYVVDKKVTAERRVYIPKYLFDDGVVQVGDVVRVLIPKKAGK